MATLHWYVLRELLKTLALTITALTALFTLGGGLFNLVHFEGVSAGDVLNFLPLLIPVIVTITLPVAALFAATMVYGRLAADNELVACRAAGINVHRLFLSAVLLAVFVAGFTLLLGNFVIPGYVSQFESFARRNLRDMAFQKLQHEGFVHYREKKDKQSSGTRYTLTAEHVQNADEAQLRAQGFAVEPGLQYMVVNHATFVQIDAAGNLVRFTTARQGLCIFDTRPTPMEITVVVADARDFQMKRHAAYLGQQTIGPFAVPAFGASVQLSASDLRDLLHWTRYPWECPKFQGSLARFVAELAQQRFYEHCGTLLNAGATLTLQDDRGRAHHIRARAAQLGKRGLELTDAEVEVDLADQPLPLRYATGRAELRAKPLETGRLFLELTLLRTAEGDVVETAPRGAVYDAPRRRPTLSLDNLQAPPELTADVAQVSAAEVVRPTRPLSLPPELEERRIGLARGAADLVRKIWATIHFRLGLTCSTLVTVLMGAALGIIFRGSRALAAFAVALIPFFTIFILMLLGRKLGEDVRTASLGPIVTWGGLVLVLLADGLIARLGVRR